MKKYNTGSFYQCHYCKNEYSYTQSRWRHEQICCEKLKQQKIAAEITQMEKIKLENNHIKELEKQNESLQKIIDDKVMLDNREHKYIEELKIQNESLYKTLQQVINDDGKLHLENQTIILQKEKDLFRENTILKQYPKNTQCVYYGMIDNTGTNNERLIKFGNSNSLYERVYNHKRTFSNFRLVAAFKVDNKIQIENAMKNHHLLTKIKFPIVINDKTQTEILNITNMSFESLDEIIKEIIITNEYSPEKYKKILFEHEILQKDYEILQKDYELLKIKYEKIKSNNDLVISI